MAECHQVKLADEPGVTELSPTQFTALALTMPSRLNAGRLGAATEQITCALLDAWSLQRADVSVHVWSSDSCSVSVVPTPKCVTLRMRVSDAWMILYVPG